MKNRTLLIVLGRGGHTKQMLRLVNKLGKKYKYEYAIAHNDDSSGKKIKIKGKIFKIYNPREMTDKNALIVFLKLFKTTIDSMKVLFKTKAETIIICGPGIAIPVSILGKLFFNKNLIFIESWSRVNTKSLSGKFLYKLADLSFIQWREQKKNYPKAIYAGRLG